MILFCFYSIYNNAKIKFHSKSGNRKVQIMPPQGGSASGRWRLNSRTKAFGSHGNRSFADR